MSVHKGSKGPHSITERCHTHSIASTYRTVLVQRINAASLFDFHECKPITAQREGITAECSCLLTSSASMCLDRRLPAPVRPNTTPWCTVDRGSDYIPFVAGDGHQKLGDAPCVLKVSHVRLPGSRRAYSSSWVEEPQHNMLGGIRPVLHKVQVSSQLNPSYSMTQSKSLEIF